VLLSSLIHQLEFTDRDLQIRKLQTKALHIHLTTCLLIFCDHLRFFSLLNSITLLLKFFKIRITDKHVLLFIVNLFMMRK